MFDFSPHVSRIAGVFAETVTYTRGGLSADIPAVFSNPRQEVYEQTGVMEDLADVVLKEKDLSSGLFSAPQVGDEVTRFALTENEETWRVLIVPPRRVPSFWTVTCSRNVRPLGRHR